MLEITEILNLVDLLMILKILQDISALVHDIGCYFGQTLPSIPLFKTQNKYFRAMFGIDK